MTTNKDEISLIVHGYDLSPLQFRVPGKDCSEHGSCKQTKWGIEVMQYQFWIMVCRITVAYVINIMISGMSGMDGSQLLTW